MQGHLSLGSNNDKADGRWRTPPVFPRLCSMRALLRMCACLLFIVASVTPAAASPADPDQTHLLSEEADRLGLSDDPQWIKLIHYRRSFLSRDSYQSDIITDAFFLAPEGRTDSRAELRSTLAALLSPIGETGNQHAQCRFPARLAWLKRRLSWPEDAPVASCPEFEMWSRTGAVEGISVIFASGHLSNPASFYGHLLVKFNSPGERAAEDLLETTLNYGAVIPPNEGAISYIINGLFGGYNSTFTHLEFFQHNHNYAETQLRDLWEYELDLTPSEVDLIVSHTWEVLGKDNKYYFVLQNCAYRIAELLNLVIEKPLVAPSKLWATPIDVFVRLASAKPGERVLVRDITRFPSRQNRFREAYRQLVESERDILTRIVNEDAGDVEQAIQGLGEQSQVRVIETLLSYYTFLETRLDPVPDHVEQEKSSLLLARLKRPPSDAPGGLAQQDPAQQPHTGNRSSLASELSLQQRHWQWRRVPFSPRLRRFSLSLAGHAAQFRAFNARRPHRAATRACATSLARSGQDHEPERVGDGLAL